MQGCEQIEFRWSEAGDRLRMLKTSLAYNLALPFTLHEWEVSRQTLVERSKIPFRGNMFLSSVQLLSCHGSYLAWVVGKSAHGPPCSLHVDKPLPTWHTLFDDVALSGSQTGSEAVLWHSTRDGLLAAFVGKQAHLASQAVQV